MPPLIHLPRQAKMKQILTKKETYPRLKLKINQQCTQTYLGMYLGDKSMVNSLISLAIRFNNRIPKQRWAKLLLNLIRQQHIPVEFQTNLNPLSSTSSVNDPHIVSSASLYIILILAFPVNIHRSHLNVKAMELKFLPMMVIVYFIYLCSLPARRWKRKKGQVTT